MALTGIVDPESQPEPPYPQALDMYHRMKMLGFQYWDGGLSNQPTVLVYEMQVINSLLESYEQEAQGKQYGALLKAIKK